MNENQDQAQQVQPAQDAGQIVLNTMIQLGFQEAQETMTARGPRFLSKAEPTGTFWDLWRKYKETARGFGFSCGKQRNDWEVLWWLPVERNALWDWYDLARANTLAREEAARQAAKQSIEERNRRLAAAGYPNLQGQERIEARLADKEASPEDQAREVERQRLIREAQQRHEARKAAMRAELDKRMEEERLKAIERRERQQEELRKELEARKRKEAEEKAANAARLEALRIAAIPSHAETSDFEVPCRPGLAYLPFQRAGIEFAVKRKNTLIGDAPGLGKQQPVSEPVLTPDGWKTMGDLRVGDYVIGSHGTPIRVLAVYPQVSRKVIALTFSDGVVVRCGPEHLWTIHETRQDAGWQTQDTQWMIANGLLDADNQPKYEIPAYLGNYKGTAIVSAEPVQDEDCVCIRVDSPDHLYVTTGYKLTHNTVQSIGFINFYPNDIHKVLIVCPATLKINWKRELDKWLVRPLKTAIIHQEWEPDADVVILNYDRLHKFKKDIDSVAWDVFVCDEAHFIKNPKARRSANVYGCEARTETKWSDALNKSVTIHHEALLPIKAKRTLFLTGTPICNRPKEIFPLVNFLDPKGFANDSGKFTARFCNGYGDASNLDELNLELRASVMVRRLKTEVLKELPPKIRKTMVIEIDAGDRKTRDLVKEEKDFYHSSKRRICQLQANVELAKAAGDQAAVERYQSLLEEARGRDLSEIARLRKAVALAKMPYVIRHIKDNCEEEPVVVFGYHHVVMDGIQAAFRDKAVRLDGRCSEADKQKAVDDFQNGKADVFVGNLKAAGVGITLTRSNHVICAELDWTPAVMLQAEDRCVRYGSTGDYVLIEHVVLEDSLDEYMSELLILKEQICDAALDGKAIDVQEASAIDDFYSEGTVTSHLDVKGMERQYTGLSANERMSKFSAGEMRAALALGLDRALGYANSLLATGLLRLPDWNTAESGTAVALLRAQFEQMVKNGMAGK